MRQLGVNIMMMSIAFCDFGCAVIAGIYLILGQPGHGTSGDSFVRSIFFLVYDYLTIGFHSSSILLGVGMAFCRIMSLTFSNKNSTLWHTPKYAIRLITCIFILVFVLSLVFLPFQNIDRVIKNGNESSNRFDMSNILIAENCLYLRAAHFLLGVGFKMLPCVLLLIFSVMLLRKISTSRKTSQRLQQIQSSKHQTRVDRSSSLIVSVLIIFMLTELPQAIVHIFGAVFIYDFLSQVLVNVENILDILSSINSTVIFIIYSLLSLQFRRIFVDTFVPIFIRRYFLEKMETPIHAWTTVVQNY